MNLIVSSRSVPVLRTLWRTALPAVASLVAISAEAQIQVDHAVVEFDELVRSYNAIVLGDATFNNGQHSHAGVAVGGNLTSNGWIYAQQVDSGADPTLYVTGTTTLNGESKLERGYATLNPGQTGTWNSPNPRDLTSGGGKLTVQNNTNIAQATLDPRTNPAPAGWNWATLETQFIKISETLAAAAQTTGASIHLDGQTLVFDAGTNTSGSVVFNLTATLLTGLGYYSGVVVNVPADTVFIINVSGFDGGSLFAGTEARTLTAAPTTTR